MTNGTLTKDVFSAVVDPDRLAVRERERTGLLRATGDTTFDRFARVASAVLDTPVSFVTLVGLDEQVLRGAWRRAELDNDARSMPLRETFRRFSVATGEELVINDARGEPPVQHSAPVTSKEIIEYAGFPLRTGSGHVLGSLYVIDRQPHEWSARQRALLRDLTTTVLQEIEHRLANRLASKSVDNLRALGQQLADRLSGTVDAVHGLAELAEQQDDLRLHRFTALAVSRMDQVKDLTSRLQQETAAQLDRAGEPARIDLREAVDRAVRSTRLATSTGAIEADLGPVALPVRCDPLELERSITHVLVAALHHMTGESPLRVVLGKAGLHAQVPVAQLTVSGPSSRVPASELARIVARLRAATGEAMVERSQVASIRMIAGQMSASNGSIVANSTADGLTLVGQWTL